METKPEFLRCPRCQREQETDQFYADRSKTSGRKSHCKTCTKSDNRKWKTQNCSQVAEYEKARRQRAKYLRELGEAAEELILRHRCLLDPRSHKSYVEIFDAEPGTRGIYFVDKDKTRCTRKDRKLNQPQAAEAVWTTFWELFGDDDVDPETQEIIKGHLLECLDEIRLSFGQVDDWQATKQTCLKFLQERGLLPR